VSRDPFESVNVNLQTDHGFQAVLRRADRIYDGTEPDITDGALFYADLSDPGLAESFRLMILGNPESHPRIGTVGRNSFFR